MSDIQKETVVFGFGSNAEGQLGIKKEETVSPVKLDHLSEVEFVNAWWKACAIDQSDNLYLQWERQTFAAGAKQATSIGENESEAHFVIDAAGVLWSWGKNDSGQLGHGDLSEQAEPKLIEALKGKHVIEVSSNSDCKCFDVTVACVTADYTCYVWGNCERFGLGSKVKIPTQLDKKVKSISIGGQHAMIVDINNNVYGIGENLFGELGCLDHRFGSSWAKIGNVTGRVIKVQCGFQCSAILTTDGVFTMGNFFDRAKPQLVLSSVTDISLKFEHILALTTNNELYSWGSNENGACGIPFTMRQNQWNGFYHGISERISKPTRVHGLEAYDICQISAGFDYSLVRCALKS